MFIKKISSLKQALSKASKFQPTIKTVIPNRPQANFSLFQKNPNKLPTQNIGKLFNTSKFSFSSSRHITQSTCLSDLELVKNQIPTDTLISMTAQFTKYANSPSLSALSLNEARLLAPVLLQLAGFLQHLPLKPAYYMEANAFCKELAGEDAMGSYIGIFMDFWGANMIEELKPWVEKMGKGYHKHLAEEPHYHMLAVIGPIYSVARGVVLQHEGKLDEALEAYEKAIAVFTAPGSRISFDLPKIYQEIARIQFQKGQREEALASCKKVDEIFEPSLKNTSNFAVRCFEIATMLMKNGYATEALPPSTKALNIMKQESPAGYDILLKISMLQARIYDKIQDYKNALLSLEASLGYYKKQNRENLFQLSEIFRGLASVNFWSNNLAKVSEPLEKAIELESKLHGSESLQVAELLTHWGKTFFQKEETQEESRKCYERALNILKKQSPQNNDKISHVLLFLGRMYDQQKKTPEALQAWKESEEYLKKMPQPNPTTESKLLAFRARNAYGTGKWEESLKLWKKAREVPGIGKDVLGDCWFNEGCAYIKNNHPQEAFEALSRAMELFLEVYGPENEQTMTCMKLLLGIMKEQGVDMKILDEELAKMYEQK